MIRTKAGIKSHYVEPVERDYITATDLNRTLNDDADGGWSSYSVLMHDGGTEESSAQMIYTDSWGRAGIVWGGDADWFDADSPEQAAQRWVDGSWIDYE